MKRQPKETIDDILLRHWNSRVLSNIGNGDFDPPVKETKETYGFFLEKAYETAGESNARLDHMEFMRSQGHRFSKHHHDVSREVVQAFEIAARRMLKRDHEGDVQPVDDLTTVTNARARLIQFTQSKKSKFLKPRT